ncbi:energy transducer TonB [Burkholderia diffusa]|uniref:energy transducer TonB n=1 Tax=Burkholderia diffusa TaxID=488732 RepID=UPI001E4D6C86|nr:energy transducer TonB [Burkholderia diffusa]
MLLAVRHRNDSAQRETAMHAQISSDTARKCARRRIVALAYGIAPGGAYAATIEMRQAARAREPLGAVALTVFAVHAAIMVALWHAWVLDGGPTLPRALAVEVDASEFARVAEPGVHRWRDVAKQVPPEHMPSRSSRETAAHREAQPRAVATRQVDHAGPSRKPAGAIAAAQPDGERRRTVPERESAQPAAANAVADTATVSTRATQVAQSSAAPEPVSAPRFAATYLRNPAPDYPDVAQRRGWEGTTFLNVHVLANGRPDQVLLSASSGHDALDDAAVAAVTDWRFVPAKRGTEAIDGWVRVPVVFKIGN